MNEQTALRDMVPPGQKRKSAGGDFLGGVIQIHVTRACDKACFGCTQGSNLGGKPVMISVEQFEQACASLADYFGIAGLFGGNPAQHPQFDELCRILAKYIPFERRGLWCNNPLGKGAIMRKTFNPRVSNLNVHLDRDAYNEFKRDWPESLPFGLKEDSRHSPPFVAMLDVVPDEAERWGLIANCDINRNWSAMICSVRGQLRGYFCEIAGAQAMLHQHDPTWPDTGIPVKPGWWKRPMGDFAEQVRWHCHRCGVPLKGYGELAVGGRVEQTSATHADIYKPKRAGREVELVTLRTQLGNPLEKMTDYLGNSHK